jgi:HEPN domain-containing protein
MRPETEAWWRQAQADLRTAEVNLEAGQFYGVSWFAQQAAEKALKAVYLERHHRLAPRTHDLRLLGMQLVVPQTLRIDLDVLDQTFDPSRYPTASGTAPVDAIGAGDANDHFAAARRILTWAASELGQASTQQ